ncbi:MAG: LapA family protein [Desulfobulbaceae bacterium]|uniref:LapA family protein n=1 Tax=Candidatus Desulfobia pelagia TaxID=2841692 RepID=A0A8J6TEL7_9BACT|nr:LapA family protein [Candidatus Desulfobia pelagia]
MNFKLIFSLSLIGLAVLFVVQNVAIVEIQFLIWSFSIARSVLIFCVLAIGIIAGWLLHSYSAHKRKNREEHAPDPSPTDYKPGI